MKNKTLIFLFLSVSLLFSFPINAATEDWSYDGLSNIFQVVTDGKGGCAMTRSTNSLDNIELVWLDKTGALIYQTTISNYIISAIIDCTPTQLLFSDYRSHPVFIQVDENGVETIVPSPAGKFNMLPGTGSTRFPVINTRLNDRKGFFLVRSSTNDTGATLIRYKNK